MSEKINDSVDKRNVLEFRKAGSLLGKSFGSKGGFVSAQKLTPKQRKDRASKASKARWKKKKTS